MRHILVVLLSVVSLSVMVTACAMPNRGPQPGKADTAATAFKPERGDYALRIVNLELYDDSQKKSLPVRIVYPTARDTYPVIVLSHGGGASRDDYTRASDHWASHGYVVIAPTHMDAKVLGFDIAAAGGRGMAQVMRSRISDMRFVALNLDEIARQVPELATRMDKTRLVAAGHSMGGFTALVAAGVKLKNKVDGTPLDLDDVGYKYLLLLSEPGHNPNMPDEPWRQSPVPTFIYTGTNDKGGMTTGEKSPFGNNLVDNPAAAAQPKHYLWVEGVDHYLGGLWCRSDVPGPLDYDGLKAFNGVSTAFLNAYTKNDGAALDFLKTTDVGPLTKSRATLSMK